MSQSKIKDLFILRKGNRDSQPSKRRKLVDPAIDDCDLESKRPTMEHRGRVKNVKGVQIDQESGKTDSLIIINKSSVQSYETETTGLAEAVATNALSAKAGMTRTRTPAPASKSKPRGRKPKALPISKGQQKLNFTIAKDNADTEVNDSVTSSGCREKGCNSNDFQDYPELEQQKSEEAQLSKCTEEVTSVWDDHKNQECTPRKRILTEMDSLSQGPKTRVRKTAARKLDQQTESRLPQTEMKKKLDLGQFQFQTTRDDPKAEVDEPTKTVDSSLAKSHLLRMVSEMSTVEGAITPLALTPEHPTTTPETTPTNITPKLHDLSEKLKVLSKMDGQALKNRLKKKGMLGEVKGKLQELSQANADHKKTAPAFVEPVSKGKTEETLPAHQRYDYLAKEGPPTLSLPYTYRLLESAFQAMDTVVSMLHNRSEVCTFNKLQTAVQTITKKNFPPKTVGQIKTVLPDAFVFKQERVPVYGQKNSPYVLTVEADLKDEDRDAAPKKSTAKDGKIPFTASALLRRKTVFKSSLLKTVKKHHRTFLESLTPPLRIPDHKLSRWHPKFALDKVAEVMPSDLPQPPNLQVYRSAKDVLEMQMGRLNPRVEKALMKVASESSQPSGNKTKANNNSPLPTQEKESSSPSLHTVSTPASSSSANPTQSSMKGIPPALLAKIRAKEALKMEQALTRDPSEDMKTRMMGRLPEIIRILRSYFVTEKRPALPLESVIKKLGDSYHTGMALVEMEQHVKLLKETAPELVSVVEIKRGKFVKLDKNVDITALIDRINNIVKASK